MAADYRVPKIVGPWLRTLYMDPWPEATLRCTDPTCPLCYPKLRVRRK